MTILVTGGAGFIGSHFVNMFLNHQTEAVITLDKLSYAANLNNLSTCKERHSFIKSDISNHQLVQKLLHQYKPRAIIHFAAETHVDKSIKNDTPFIETNIVATHCFLKTVLDYWEHLKADTKKKFRFIHISTDEVFGSLGNDSPKTRETNQYQPNNPYSASKAAADHLMRAYYQTYGFPVIVTHGSNTYGPSQYPEKLIPLMILRAINHKTLPVYGDGKHARDWIHVSDHCLGILRVLDYGCIGEHYNIAGEQEVQNIVLVKTLCRLLDIKIPRNDNRSHADSIRFVRDRKGHDLRYAMDGSKIKRELDFMPRIKLDQGLSDTIDWYIKSLKIDAVFNNETHMNLMAEQ